MIDLGVIRDRVDTVEQQVNDAGSQHNGKDDAKNDKGRAMRLCGGAPVPAASLFTAAWTALAARRDSGLISASASLMRPLAAAFDI